MNEKTRKLHSYPIIALFILFFAGILVAAIFTVPQEFNEKENRKLAQKPIISESKSWDEYTNAWDAFVSDQFPGRNEVTDTYSDIALSQGDTIVRDVYVLSSEYLFGVSYPLEQWKLDALISTLKSRGKEVQVPFVYIITPHRNLMLAEGEPKLDDKVDISNRDMLMQGLDKSGLPVIDCCDYMLSYAIGTRSKFYYKTDLHWNDYGAYDNATFVAHELANENYIKESSIPSDDMFEWTNYTGRPMLGDLKQRFSSEVDVEEYIPVYLPVETDNLHYYIEFNGNEVSRNGVMGRGLETDEVLDYNKITCQNYGYMRIENPNAPEVKSVLLLKDSMACAMLDYFSQIFTEINIVDPRYTNIPMDDLLHARDIGLVLLMYHQNNISEELIQYLKNW